MMYKTMTILAGGFALMLSSTGVNAAPESAETADTSTISEPRSMQLGAAMPTDRHCLWGCDRSGEKDGEHAPGGEPRKFMQHPGATVTMR